MPRSPFITRHSPLVEPHSLLFAPFGLGGMGCGELVTPPDGELAAFFLLSGGLEGRGTRREEEGMRLDEQGTRREEIFG